MTASATTAAEDWLAARIAQTIGADPGAIDRHVPVYRLGLESRDLLAAIEDAEAAIGANPDLDRISPAETIAALALALRAQA